MAAEPSNWPNIANLGFFEELYERYLKDGASVPADWRRYFDQIDGKAVAAGRVGNGPSFESFSLFNPPGAQPVLTARARPGGVSDEAMRQDSVDALVRAYRVRGHMVARIDPLGLTRPE